MAFIDLKNIEKTYNPRSDAAVYALRGISLSVSRGQMAAIIGTSGSGKSTLLHILACLDMDFEGEYIFGGIDIKSVSSRELAEIRNRRIGIVLQNFGLIHDMSVFDNVAMPVYLGRARYDRNALRKRVADLLERVGIPDKVHTRAGKLSGGQKQRTAIARALINDPDLILADEPTGALDHETSAQIMEIFKDLNLSGKTVLIVTHDMKIASECPQILEISDGKLMGAKAF